MAASRSMVDHNPCPSLRNWLIPMVVVCMCAQAEHANPLIPTAYPFTLVQRNAKSAPCETLRVARPLHSPSGRAAGNVSHNVLTPSRFFFPHPRLQPAFLRLVYLYMQKVCQLNLDPCMQSRWQLSASAAKTTANHPSPPSTTVMPRTCR